jgi:hypothetical protein
MPRNRLYRLGKTQLCGQSRVGALILGNTIGNAVAGSISQANAPQLAYADVGTDDGVTGGGQAPTPAGNTSAPDAPGGEITVTASRSSTPEQRAAASAAIDAAVADQDAADADADAAAPNGRGSHPYPAASQDMSGDTVWQLQHKFQAYLDNVAASGDTYTDNDLNVKTFQDLIAQAEVREAPGVALANKDVGDLLYYGGGMEAEMALETVTGEAVVGAAFKGVRLLRGLSAAESALPTIAFSRTTTPGIASNIEAAIADGQPSVLNRLTGRDLIRANRADALSGLQELDPSLSLDEYPFASTMQGGAGARVASVPRIEQNIQGGQLSSFYQSNGIGHGDPFRVIVVP